MLRHHRMNADGASRQDGLLRSPRSKHGGTASTKQREFVERPLVKNEKRRPRGQANDLVYTSLNVGKSLNVSNSWLSLAVSCSATVMVFSLAIDFILAPRLQLSYSCYNLVHPIM
ncbi:hypothetical protein FDV58_34090 [Bradyrhizobium elkanii]|uniref:Uncharacterized protein n=1 Tax=Bradyrhizobium elkanii TaxID=29448 RepID=A0A4U6RMJ1_BRAEL|nr:hypothetical protein [Bradyrhizobium elkanii]TKV74036.1 hypothetical protein FDV58_34090 [Bradyrhizobium elkanii]